MFIVKVIPFSRSFRKEELSYFSIKEIPVGSIVTIELRKKEIQGLVVASKKGKDLKSEIKSSAFKLKKIKGSAKNILIRKELVRSAKKTADYFSVNTGPVLQTLIPNKLFSELKKIKEPQQPKKIEKDDRSTRYAIQDQYFERYSNYKNLIREEFAKKRSVLFVCPTMEDVSNAKKLLSKGIEENTFSFNSSMTTNQLIKEWNAAIEHPKQVLIICTGTFIGIPRHDIGSIVLEKESSRLYKTQKSPYIDLRTAAENYADEINARLIVGDLMLRAETLWRYDKNEFYEFAPLKFRSLSSANQMIIDMKQDKHNAGNAFCILSNETRNIIRQTKLNNQHTFFFAARKGLAPIVVCGDCGQVVVCDKCQAPVVLHGKNATEETNYFKCHVCGDERHAGEKCKNCTSWKLQTLGIGAELVEKELKKEYPDQKVFRLDSDIAKTQKQAKEIINQFYDTPGSILVGTEMALLYMHDPVENAVVITIDALLGVPDFSIRERILRILLQIRSRAQQNFFIQTRKIEDPIFEFAKQGNLAEFYRQEFADRAKFKYPPFSIIIKIALAGTKYAVTKEFEYLKEYFEPHEFLTFPSFSSNKKGNFVMNGIIRLKRDSWIDKDLQEKLSNLPPQYKVVVDAESLL